MSSKQRTNLLRVLVLLFVIAVSIYIFSIRDQAKELAKFGYPGIFFLSILANATVILPAPGVLFVFAMGAVFNPVGVAIAAGAGAAIAEIGKCVAGSPPVRDHSESPLYLHNAARAPIPSELPRREERGPIGLRGHPVQTDAPHQGGPRAIE